MLERHAIYVSETKNSKWKKKYTRIRVWQVN